MEKRGLYYELVMAQGVDEEEDKNLSKYTAIFFRLQYLDNSNFLLILKN